MTVQLYLAQFRESLVLPWRNVGEWCASAEEATIHLQHLAPKGREYRVLAVAAEDLPVTATPTVERLEPSTAFVGDPDLTLHVYGTGFDVTSRIVWNGTEEATVYVSATELTTLVKPSTASGPWLIPVSVTGAAATLSFQFIDAATPDGGA